MHRLRTGDFTKHSGKSDSVVAVLFWADRLKVLVHAHISRASLDFASPANSIAPGCTSHDRGLHNRSEAKHDKNEDGPDSKVGVIFSGPSVESSHPLPTPRNVD